MTRTTIILAVVAVAMLGFIVFYEQDLLSSRELEQRKGHILQRFVRDQVHRLELRGKRETVVLERELVSDDEEDVETLEAGQWRLVEPTQADVDADAMDMFLGELEWLDALRSFRDVSAEDLERFGLKDPAWSLSFSVKEDRVKVAVGKETPQGEGRYLRVDEQPTVHVIRKDAFQELDRGASHFHTKQLYSNRIVSTLVESVELDDEQASLRLEKREEGWWLIRPVEAPAAESAVESLIRAYSGLEAKRYIQAEIGDPRAFGFAEPYLDARLHVREHIDTHETQRVHVRVGAPCGEHAEERYIHAGDGGAVFCIGRTKLEKLGPPAAELREAAFLPASQEAISRVRIQSGGSRLVLERDEEGWRYTLFEAGKRAAAGEAASNAVDEWMGELQDAQAEQFVPAEDLKAKWLDPAARTVWIETKKDAASERVFQVGEAVEDRVYVRREGAADLRVYDASLLESLAIHAARWRDRGLVSQSPEALIRLRIERGGHVETLERTEDGWRVQKPVQAEADRIAINGIAGRLSSLEAVRFVGDRAASDHGLASPQAEVRFFFEAGAEDDAGSSAEVHTLRIGAQARDGYFARLDDDPAVFVLASATAELLLSPLLDRDALAVARGRIEALTLRRPGEETPLRIERGDAGDLRRVRGDEGLSVPAVVAAVGTLRASEVLRYGTAQRDEGLHRPRATLVVETRGDADGERETYELRIGASLGGEESIYVRRSDLPATFIVPSSQVAPLLQGE